MNNHQDFNPFLYQALGPETEAGTIIEVLVKSPNGEEVFFEAKEQELEFLLFEAVKDLLN